MSPGVLAAVQFSWLAVLPLGIVALAAVAVLLAGARAGQDQGEALGWFSAAALAAAALPVLASLGRSRLAFDGTVAVDAYSVYFELVILFASAMTVLISLRYVAEMGLAPGEYYALVLFAALGMMLMAAADDLILIFLGLETMSLAVYALAGFARRQARSAEAALKYFLLGAFSTGFLLYGIALIYGAAGTLKLEPLRAALAAGTDHRTLLLCGVGLVLIGFAFKVAAVPFHMWTPDAYEGAPTPIAGFMAVGVKLASFAAFLRVFGLHLGALAPTWTAVVWVVAALTMTAGNLIALAQQSLKRMLAYSAIAHAGYLLVGMAAGSNEAAGAILYYLLGYAFTNLGAFAVVVALERRGVEHESIADLRGLGARAPGLSAALALLLLSLTGMPPLAGFVGKLYLFKAALDSGLVWLVVIAVLNSVVSAYYYLRVLVAVYMQEGGVAVAPLAARPALLVAVGAAVLGTVLIGVFPAPYVAAAGAALRSALSLSSPGPLALIAR
jgi:NADH-quinone oxidoreductase subunit N